MVPPNPDFILAQVSSGCVVREETTLKKQAAAQRAQLGTLTDTAARKAAMAELARLEMLQAIAEESRRKFLR